MGWAVSYQLNRQAPLSEDERALLIDHVGKHNRPKRYYEPYDLQLAEAPRSDQALAWGFTKLHFDRFERDLERLCVALTELRGLFEGTTCFVCCDFGTVLWDEASGAYSETSGEADPDVKFVTFVEDAPSALELSRKKKKRKKR